MASNLTLDTLFTEKSTSIVEFGQFAGSLFPTTASTAGNDRYESTTKVEPKPIIIDAGMFLSSRVSLPQYLPPLWTMLVHPEGGIYFFREASLRIVTLANLHVPEIAKKVTHWVAVIEKRLMDMPLASTHSIEIFVHMEGNDCLYYLADHESKTIFWLDSYDSNDLGLMPVSSPSHLKLLLEEQYWSHIETFPIHLKGLTTKTVEDLIGVFAHGLADQMTSSTSTFPYDAEACKKILKVLTISKDIVHDGHITCYVARLWSLIVHNRYWTHYGQPHARLSRDQSIIIDDSPREIQWTKRIISAITLNISEYYIRHLDGLYIDRFVYATQWCVFMASCNQQWRRNHINVIGLLMLHIFFFFVSPSLVLAGISGTLASAGLLTSVYLVHHHEELEKATASEALSYLSNVHSAHFKFQWVALAYSLPKAFYLWSLVIFLSHWVWIACQQISTTAAACLIAFATLALLAFRLALSPKEVRGSILPVFRSKRHKESESEV